MSNFLNEQTVMQFYIEQIDKDSIVFCRAAKIAVGSFK